MVVLVPEILIAYARCRALQHRPTLRFGYLFSSKCNSRRSLTGVIKIVSIVDNMKHVEYVYPEKIYWKT